MVMSEIESKLEEIEKSTNQAPRIPRDSIEAKKIFRHMTENEFIGILENLTSGRPNITYTPTDWVFKKAFPVNDRKQLQTYLIANWKHGVEDSKMLNRCYPRIKEDLKNLVDEGWIRVLLVNKTNSRKAEETAMTSVFFACDKSDFAVEGVLDTVPNACHNFLADIWDKELDETKTNWEKILQDTPSLLSN